MSLDLSDAFGEFISECEEITQRVSKHLQLIEKGQGTDETLDAIYRDVHTLKGSANLYGFSQLGQLAHAMEAGMEPYRKKLAILESGALDALFKGLDILEELLSAVRSKKEEPDLTKELVEIIPKLIDSTLLALAVDFNIHRDVMGSKEDLDRSQLPRQKPSLTTQLPEIKQRSNERDNHMEADSDSPPNSSGSNPGGTSGSDPSQTIRVQISRLDKLMNLIGEMVLVRNQVLQFSKYSEDTDFLKLGKRLDLVTSELQGEVMQTRMQPIGTVLEKFQRVVRDLNKDLGKKIELILVGTETEVDKSLLEAVKDPLTHLIRNACDHGLETPDQRRAVGKSPTGKVTVRSFHEGGQVVIEISDDGRGLNRERILAKAIEKNLVTQADVAKLSDQEIYHFIFAPGFSTAQNVTTVSGRGVGMDVVRTNIEKIGGTIELSTALNQGTNVRLRIPLTLAIVPAMVIRVGNNRFAIPQVKLVELVRAHQSNATQAKSDDEPKRNQVEYLQGKPMFRMRGLLLPLVSLKEILQITSDSDQLETTDPGHLHEDASVINIVVLNGDGCQFGLIVDEIQDTTDIVVKPLTRFLKNLSIYSGATIMGDGSVVLIFDVGGIAKKAELTSDSAENNEHQEDTKVANAHEIQEFLLFKTAAAARHAMALCLVQRLEEFDRKSIEYAGQQPVVRYRDTILPLIFMNICLGYTTESDIPTANQISVIVVQKHGRNFGLVVDEILDVITTESIVDDAVKDRDGLLGSLLHGQEIISVADPLEIIDKEYYKMNGQQKSNEENSSDAREGVQNQFHNIHILYAEDTAFFRKQVVKSLEKLGFKVSVANDGKEALEKLEREGSNTYSIVLSDIEMPVMTGFELASAIRASEKLKNIPLIALTTRFKTSDQEEGARVGFNLYLEKFNSDQVVNGIEKLLKLQKRAG